MVTLLIYLPPVNLMTSLRNSQRQRDISQIMRLSYVIQGELSLPLQSGILNFENSKQLKRKIFGGHPSVPLAYVVILVTPWRDLWNVEIIL